VREYAGEFSFAKIDIKAEPESRSRRGASVVEGVAGVADL